MNRSNSMKKPRIITIKNDLPEILAALCNHPACPDWLRTDVYDAVNERISGEMTYSPIFWRSMLETVVDERDGLDRENDAYERRVGSTQRQQESIDEVSNVR